MLAREADKASEADRNVRRAEMVALSGTAASMGKTPGASGEQCGVVEFTELLPAPYEYEYEYEYEYDPRDLATPK